MKAQRCGFCGVDFGAQNLYSEAFADSIFSVNGLPEEFNLSVKSISKMNCEVSLYNSLGVLLFNTKIAKPTSVDESNFPYRYNLVKITSEDETFVKLKDLPRDVLILVFRMKFPGGYTIKSLVRGPYTSMNRLDYLKKLSQGIKALPESFAKEHIQLSTNKEVRLVNKAVWCAKSPHFAELFQGEFREHLANVVTVEGATKSVMEYLVAFLYTGQLPEIDDIKLICDLYRGAHRYELLDLRDACCDLLRKKINVKTVFDVLKMALLYKNDLLKISMMAFICENFEDVVKSGEWVEWMHHEPLVALEALDFLYF
ncbi:TD and POZ domain-containing protein 3 [Caerostris darwini]|uniref:TD and POZ domain-containing protein 3 n=1 Tax=Caerostris darwini TaxID=1538125 RepID=A0AAV4X565_9ARAC|nr:TD and POZ domain-containing protein 3 [Caerostris darwini]